MRDCTFQNFTGGACPRTPLRPSYAARRADEHTPDRPPNFWLRRPMTSHGMIKFGRANSTTLPSKKMVVSPPDNQGYMSQEKFSLVTASWSYPPSRMELARLQFSAALPINCLSFLHSNPRYCTVVDYYSSNDTLEPQSNNIQRGNSRHFRSRTGQRRQTWSRDFLASSMQFFNEKVIGVYRIFVI